MDSVPPLWPSGVSEWPPEEEAAAQPPGSPVCDYWNSSTDLMDLLGDIGAGYTGLVGSNPAHGGRRTSLGTAAGQQGAEGLPLLGPGSGGPAPTGCPAMYTGTEQLASTLDPAGFSQLQHPCSAYDPTAAAAAITGMGVGESSTGGHFPALHGTGGFVPDPAAVQAHESSMVSHPLATPAMGLPAHFLHTGPGGGGVPAGQQATPQLHAHQYGFPGYAEVHHHQLHQGVLLLGSR